MQTFGKTQKLDACEDSMKQPSPREIKEPPTSPPPTTLALADDGGTDIERSVRNGVKFLDAVYPGWRSDIKIKVLDMNSRTKDIGAMLYGRFGKAMMTLFPEIKGLTGPPLFQKPVAHGFVAPRYLNRSNQQLYHRKLTRLWILAVQRGRNEAT